MAARRTVLALWWAWAAFAGPDPQAVYDRLVAAGAITQAPTLRLCGPAEPGCAGEIARFDPAHMTIVLARDAVTRCGSLTKEPADCVALLLGHELGHFRDWQEGRLGQGGGFAAAAGSGGELARPELERRADAYVGWLGHLAGYATAIGGAGILERLYLDLKPDPALYPPLEERIRAVSAAAQESPVLVAIYRAGLALLLDGAAEAAVPCFEHLARRFPAPDVLNNAGVARALSVKPAWPWVLDTGLRLEAFPEFHARDTGFGERQLRRAADLFAEASRRDPEYAPARVNRFLAAHELGYHETPVLRAHALKAAGTGPMREVMTRALRATQVKSPVQATRKTRTQPARTDPRQDACREPVERINGLDRPPSEGGQPIAVAADTPLRLRVKSGETWYWMAAEFDGTYWDVMGALPGYEGRSACGIGAGSTEGALHRAYGPPDRRFPARTGTFWYYHRRGALFFVDAQGAVRHWLILGRSNG